MKIVIKGEPRTKKNSQQILINKATGRPFIMPSKEYRAYEQYCSVYMPRLKKPIDYPVNVECKFYRSTRRKVDLCNLIECAADILVKYGVLADDNRNVMYSVDGSRVFYDKTDPRAEITIEPVENYERWKEE